MATKRSGSVECVGGTVEKYTGIADIWSSSNMGAPWKSSRETRGSGERKEGDGGIGNKVYEKARSGVCECEVYIGG
jgi:hypothetical protein